MTRNAMTSLVIVDVQAAFSIPPKLVERIGRYARKFRRRVFTRFINPPGSPFRRTLAQNCCAPGSADTQLLLRPAKGDIVLNKASYGLPPRAITRLKKAGITRAVVCGMDTDACVLGVMFSLFDAGIPCEAKKDLCWSSTGLHEEAMKIIKKQFP
jgi:nicotinamidase-related amidase